MTTMEIVFDFELHVGVDDIDEESREIDYPDEDIWEDEEKEEDMREALAERLARMPRAPSADSLAMARRVYPLSLFRGIAPLPLLPPPPGRRVPVRDSTECAVCLESFHGDARPQVYCAYKCGNRFHKNCTSSVRRCPLCREPFYHVPVG